jgi:hypothetical protein
MTRAPPIEFDKLVEAMEAAEAAQQAAAEAVEKLAALAPRGRRRTVLINVKVAEETAVALAKRAVAEGVTQKQLVVQALAAIGLPVDPYDREDRRT